MSAVESLPMIPALRRLIPFEEAGGKVGVTNIRTVGKVSFPKPDFQSCDGKLPGLDFNG